MFIESLSTSEAGSFGKLLAYNYEGDLKFVYLNNRPYQARSTLINKNSNESLYYSFTFSVNKFGRSCNTIMDPFV